MGNSIILHPKRKMSNFKDQRLDVIGTDCFPAHRGIKTVRVDNDCCFSTDSAICVCILTWNMNGKGSAKDIAELIGMDRRFHILAVGLQEVPNCNVASLLQSVLVETHILLGSSIMESLQLYIFGLKKSDIYVSDIRSDQHALEGWGGLIGRKKGAVSIYINFHGVRMVFVTCHLSAHEKNVKARNSECKQISHSLFSEDRNPYARPSNVTLWFGDLNYRVQGISKSQARNLINGNLYRLISKDQLLEEAEKGEVFNGYCEGVLSFKPTYKYDIGGSIYDTSNKNRIPSWTDRILFKIDGNSGIEASLRSYRSIEHINCSDHKPIRAHLCLKLKTA